jgi:hypothetical protein
MRVVRKEADLPSLLDEAQGEAGRAFGNPAVFLEKYIPRAKHIEVQVLGDRHGNVIHLYERDCSVQRRHQKVVEVAPSFGLPEDVVQELCDAAARLAREIRYDNAGTVEFLYDRDRHEWFFIEMNPRIQVEHTVTEVITGLDLVRAQLELARQPLQVLPRPAVPLAALAAEPAVLRRTHRGDQRAALLRAEGGVELHQRRLRGGRHRLDRRGELLGGGVGGRAVEAAHLDPLGERLGELARRGVGRGDRGRELGAERVDGRLRDLHREMRIVRLGEGVDATGRFSAEALARTEAALLGQPWSEATVRAAMAVLAEELRPLSDFRGSAEYRLTLAQNLLLKSWLEDAA